MEKSQYMAENPADIKAAAKMAKLYDEILKVNALETDEDRHFLNVFLTRLLFCYYAEDSNIFPEGIFTSSIKSHTKPDATNLDNYLERLFDVLNTEERNRPKNTPAYLDKFPYVNGGLFRDSYPIPPFTAKARQILIEVGTLNWAEINPDIFGSMVQAVITPEHRSGLGMHYTSVPNIMKVINPLFLDELYEEFDKSFENVKKLRELIERISNIKVFDPACGSGNFLIIAYKKLRELEIAILQRIDTLSTQQSLDFSQIRLDNFYGIEIDDFAHEVAILSMWLVEHQMNMKFYEAFGRTSPTLPLKAGGNIVAGNATRLDWEVVCPKNDGDEVYLLGNPPFSGKKEQNKEQKEDMHNLFYKKTNSIGILDYVTCWYLKASQFIQKTNIKVSFVSTNSISQGEQVSILWDILFKKYDIVINFAYQTFEWKNNAKANAAVHVVIIGFSQNVSTKKVIFETSNNKSSKRYVKNINPYLVEGNSFVIKKRSSSICGASKINYGSISIDNGFFILSKEEKNKMVKENKYIDNFIYQYGGGAEYIKGIERYCLWLKDITAEDIERLPEISRRIDDVKKFRLDSSRIPTKKLANSPHLFGEDRQPLNDYLLIPKVSSERREYIPIGFQKKQFIANGSCLVIDNANILDFAVLTSKIHMAWTKYTCGRMKSDYQYSSSVFYNNFPFPDISQKQKDAITELVYNILDEREKHSEKTLAQLYDPDKMPDGLREAHHELDLSIEQCYRKKPFDSNEERLEYLFGLYEVMVGGE